MASVCMRMNVAALQSPDCRVSQFPSRRSEYSGEDSRFAKQKRKRTIEKRARAAVKPVSQMDCRCFETSKHQLARLGLGGNSVRCTV